MCPNRLTSVDPIGLSFELDAAFVLALSLAILRAACSGMNALTGAECRVLSQFGLAIGLAGCGGTWNCANCAGWPWKGPGGSMGIGGGIMAG